jgi:hypothetical protein
MAGKEVMSAQFDPQDSPSVTAAMQVLRSDPSIPKEFIQGISAYLEAQITGEGVKVTLSNVKKVNHEVLSRTLDGYDILALRGTDQTYYIRPQQNGQPLQDIYEPIDKEDFVNIVTEAYERTTGTVDGSAIDKICYSLDKKIRKERTIPRVDNTIIQVTPTKFWNTENGDLTDTVPKGKLCFRRLFNTVKSSRHIVKYDDDAFYDYGLILEEYVDETFAELTLSKGDLVEDPDFEFVQTWACHDHGRYMDILRMFATFFMKEKPLGTYILEGNGRNGKSSLIGLIHTLMGTRNTSRLQLAELGNWHKNHCLANTLVNAPDEEKPGTLEDTDLFRTIADHGDIELDVMRGQKPISISCDFQCVSASNHMPHWEGTDAEACIRRARIIPLRADLSANDNKSFNFEEETYTPERMVHFLGVVLGIARYYMDKDFPESDSVAVQRELLQENMISYRLYYQEFCGYFGKYHKLREVYDDYVIWCKDKGFKINKYDEFKEAFNDSREKVSSFNDFKVSLSRVYRVSKLRECFYAEWRCPEADNYGTITQMHESGISAISLLNGLKEHTLEDAQEGLL